MTYRSWTFYTFLLCFKLESEDGLPTSVCKECKKEVLQIYIFKQKFENSNKILQQFLAINTEKEPDNETIKIEKDRVLQVQNNQMEGKIILEEENENNPEEKENLHALILNSAEGSVSDAAELNQVVKVDQTLAVGVDSKLANELAASNNKRIVTEKGGLHLKCEICTQNCASERKLNVHYRMAHATVKHATCRVCKKSVERRRYRRHILLHLQPKPFTCDICNAKCSNNFNLQRHKLVHTKEALHCCPKCAKQFTRPDNLKVHLSYCLSLQPKSKRQRTLTCDVCKKTFVKETSLNIHKYVLTDFQVKLFI